MSKPKQSPPDKGKLRKHTSDMLKLDTDTHIIGSAFDPVRIIGDLIGYQRVLIKIKAGKSGGEMMAKSMCEKEFQKKSDELAKYIDRKAREFRSLHFSYGLKEIKEFICILFKNAPPMKPKVSEAEIRDIFLTDTKHITNINILIHYLKTKGVEVK